VAAAVLGTSAAVWAALKLQRWYAHHAVRRRMVAQVGAELVAARSSSRSRAME